MAFTIPERLASHAVTPGERKVFGALRDQLPEDYLVYYNIPIAGRYPDFVIVGADLGVVVLEVKDWRLGSILEAGPDRLTLRGSNGGESVEQNPVQQARDYCLKIVDRLKSHPLLGDGRRLGCGWGFAAPAHRRGAGAVAVRG